MVIKLLKSLNNNENRFKALFVINSWRCVSVTTCDIVEYQVNYGNALVKQYWKYLNIVRYNIHDSKSMRQKYVCLKKNEWCNHWLNNFQIFVLLIINKIYSWNKNNTNIVIIKHIEVIWKRWCIIYQRYSYLIKKYFFLFTFKIFSLKLPALIGRGF